MKNKTTRVFLTSILMAFGFCNFSAKAQLTVTNAPPYNTVANLVQNVLLGPGVTASNFTMNGIPIAFGFFDGTNSNLGLDSGIIMTSGDINLAPGPNNSSSAALISSLPGDPDLNIIMAPTISYDACIIEFDFIPMSDTIKFRYVFGSDEYMEWVSSFPGGINDGFGFFLSGPGITGPFSNNSKNIALIPGTSLPVTMFNLNLNSYGQYYFDNGNGMGSGTAPDGLTVQYDGFTVPLTAVSAVTCGQTYHIKIAIGDGGDGWIDSGVFLEAGSFASAGAVVGSASSGANINGNDSTLYEGCGSLVVYFDRGNDTLTQDTVQIIYSGTATNGVDVNPALPNQIIFPIGADSVGIVISAVMDGISEGMETIQFIIMQSGPCSSGIPDTVTIYIMNVDPITLQMDGDTVCPGGTANISVIASDGMPGYQYSWSNGLGSTSAVTANPLLPTTYTVFVTDTCGNQAQQTVNVLVTQPTAVITFGFATVNTIDFNGASSYSNIVTYSWDFGDGNTSTLQNPSHTYPNDQTYVFVVTLTVTDANGCVSTITEIITIYPDFYFYTPNSFTPNGDGHNETYSAAGVGLIEYQMMIFNRWGELVYKTDDINKGWDGKFNGGDIVQQDVYVAVFDVLAPMNKKIHKVTHVSVIR